MSCRSLKEGTTLNCRPPHVSRLHRALAIGVSLLTSEDDSSSEDHLVAIPSQSDACRGGLYSHLSTVVPWQRNELGLFTERPLKKGAFVGLYMLVTGTQCRNTSAFTTSKHSIGTQLPLQTTRWWSHLHSVKEGDPILAFSLWQL